MSDDYDFSNAFTTQEGAVFDMKGATCPNGHESKLSHIKGVSGMFTCPKCGIVYDEPTFEPDSFITVIDT